MATERRVLFVCTGNAGRSQMAEALCRQAVGPEVEVLSAGVAPWQTLHPVAVRLLAERGLAVTGQHPKPVSAVADREFDLVVTIGSPALVGTPPLPGNPRRWHWDLPDPGDTDGTPGQEAAFRVALAAITARLPEVVALLRSMTPARALHLAPAIATAITRPDSFAPARHLPLIAAAGFRAIEVTCYFADTDFRWGAIARLDELVRSAADTGVAVHSLHVPDYWLPVADPRRNRFLIDVTRAFADLAAELNALYIVIHAGLPPGLERPAAESCLETTLRELEQHVLPLPCRIAWENEPRGLTPEEHLAWISRFSPAALGLLHDVGHSHLLHNTEFYLKQAGHRLCGLHLHDNDGQNDLHVLPGRGTIAWRGLAARLAQHRYTGPLTLEAEVQECRGDLPAALRQARAALDLLGGEPAPAERTVGNE